MAKTAKERKRARKKSRQEETFSLKQEFSPNLKAYLQFIRDNEKVVLGMFVGLILLASVVFAWRDYRSHLRKTANLEYQLKVLKGEKRTAYLERRYQPESTNPRFAYELARDRYTNGRRDEALDLLKPLEERFAKSVKVPKPYNNIYSFLAVIHYQKKEFKVAEPYFMRAVKLRAYDGEFKLLFGEFLLRAGQPLEAAGWLEHLVNNPKYRARAREMLEEIEARLTAPATAGDSPTTQTSGATQPRGADAVTTDSILRMFEPAPKKN